MNGWTKHFKDGLIETGFDRDVEARKSSWRHGRLSGLVSVSLDYESLRITLSAGEGNWWQSDTMTSRFAGYGNKGKTFFLTRRLEYQISKEDLGKFISSDTQDDHVLVKVSHSLPPINDYLKEAIQVNQSHVGKWLFVSLDIQSNTVAISFHDNKK